LVLVDDDHVEVQASEVRVAFQRATKEVGQLGQERVAEHAAVLVPGPEEAVARVLIDLRIGVRLQRLPRGVA
jgi:hypothetical protein